jgi:hypothetical protein
MTPQMDSIKMPKISPGYPKRNILFVIPWGKNLYSAHRLLPGLHCTTPGERAAIDGPIRYMLVGNSASKHHGPGYNILASLEPMRRKFSSPNFRARYSTAFFNSDILGSQVFLLAPYPAALKGTNITKLAPISSINQSTVSSILLE